MIFDPEDHVCPDKLLLWWVCPQEQTYSLYEARERGTGISSCFNIDDKSTTPPASNAVIRRCKRLQSTFTTCSFPLSLKMLYNFTNVGRLFRFNGAWKDTRGFAEASLFVKHSPIKRVTSFCPRHLASIKESWMVFVATSFVAVLRKTSGCIDVEKTRKVSKVLTKVFS